jgi:gas vesicle protein
MLKRSLEGLEICIRTKGNEIDETRLPKIEKIQRVIQLIDNNINQKYYDMAEEVHGEIQGEFLNETEEEQEHNRKVFNYVHELEMKEWDELWSIIKGNDDKGSDMRGWWD